jgi:hypothetical protein
MSVTHDGNDRKAKANISHNCKQTNQSGKYSSLSGGFTDPAYTKEYIGTEHPILATQRAFIRNLLFHFVAN